MRLRELQRPALLYLQLLSRRGFIELIMWSAMNHTHVVIYTPPILYWHQIYVVVNHIVYIVCNIIWFISDRSTSSDETCLLSSLSLSCLNVLLNWTSECVTFFFSPTDPVPGKLFFIFPNISAGRHHYTHFFCSIHQKPTKLVRWQ